MDNTDTLGDAGFLFLLKPKKPPKGGLVSVLKKVLVQTNAGKSLKAFVKLGI